MHRSRITFAGLVAVLAFAGFGLAGCHEEGPAEKAGRAIDEAAEDVQEGVQDLTKKDGPLEEAGEAVDDAVDDVKDAAEDAMD
jgi:hypothetical protein